MPWNGSGVFSRLYSWVADRENGIDITASRMDGDEDDIAQGLMACLTCDGQTVPTANLPMRGYRHTGASDGVGAGDYVTVRQLTSGTATASFASLTLSGNLSVGGTTALAAVTANTITTASAWVTDLAVTDRAAIPALDFGAWGQPRTGYVDGATGNMGLNGTLTVAGTVYSTSGRIIAYGASNPALTLINTAGGGPFAVFNNLGNFGFGTADTAGGPTAYFAYFDGGGNFTLQHNLAVAGQSTFSGNVYVPSLQATGAGAGLAFEDRVAPGQEWIWYAQAGAARLWFGGDRVTVDSGSNMTVGGNLQVNGNVTANALTVTQNANIQGSLGAGALAVSGASTFNGNVTANNALTVAQNANIQGSLGIVGGLDVTGGSTLRGNVTAVGALTVGQAVEVGGHFQVDSGGMDVYSNATIHASFAVQGSLAFNAGFVGNIQINPGSSGNITGVNYIDTTSLNVSSIISAFNIQVTGGNIYPDVDNARDCGLGGKAWAFVSAYNFSNASDATLKSDIADLPAALPLVAAIAPKRFRYSSDEAGLTHWGFVAQDVAAAMAAAGHTFDGCRRGADGKLELAYNELVAVLWQAVRELAGVRPSPVSPT